MVDLLALGEQSIRQFVDTVLVLEGRSQKSASSYSTCFSIWSCSLGSCIFVYCSLIGCCISNVWTWWHVMHGKALEALFQEAARCMGSKECWGFQLQSNA